MNALLIQPLAFLGQIAISLLAATGRISIFAMRTLRYMVPSQIYWRELASALLNVGWQSLPVVGLTAIFTGGALALQIYSGGTRFNAEAVVPQIVAIGIVRELGPVLVGLMIAARVTSSIAAEIATMKVTEQIDALITLSTDPMPYLIVPRVLAAIITVPILVALGDIIGIAGGYGVSTINLGFHPATYIENTISFLQWRDVSSSLIKGAVFGGLAALMGCWYGINSQRGAMGVGHATKSSVQAAAILILSANFILTGIFFSI